MKKLLLIAILAMSIVGMAQNVCPPTIEHFDFYFNTPVVTGQKVGGVSYCEPDTGQIDTWSFVDPYSLFWLETSTGDILVSDENGVNGNGTYQYDLTVSITDNGTPPLTTIATITLWATKPNEPPSIIAQ